jgi:hypothetical protein
MQKMSLFGGHKKTTAVAAAAAAATTTDSRRLSYNPPKFFVEVDNEYNHQQDHEQLVAVAAATTVATSASSTPPTSTTTRTSSYESFDMPTRQISVDEGESNGSSHRHEISTTCNIDLLSSGEMKVVGFVPAVSDHARAVSMISSPTTSTTKSTASKQQQKVAVAASRPTTTTTTTLFPMDIESPPPAPAASADPNHEQMSLAQLKELYVINRTGSNSSTSSTSESSGTEEPESFGAMIFTSFRRAVTRSFRRVPSESEDRRMVLLCNYHKYQQEQRGVTKSNDTNGDVDGEDDDHMTLTSKCSNGESTLSTTNEEAEAKTRGVGRTNHRDGIDDSNGKDHPKLNMMQASDIRNEYAQTQFNHWKNMTEDGPPLLRATVIMLSCACLLTTIVQMMMVMISGRVVKRNLGLIVCGLHTINFCFWILVLEIQRPTQSMSSALSSSPAASTTTPVPNTPPRVSDNNKTTTAPSTPETVSTAATVSSTMTPNGNCDYYFTQCWDPLQQHVRSNLRSFCLRYINGLRYLSGRGGLWLLTGSLNLAMGNISCTVTGSLLMTCGCFAVMYGLYASHRLKLLSVSLTDVTFLWNRFGEADDDRDGMINVDQFSILLSSLGLVMDTRYAEDVFNSIASPPTTGFTGVAGNDNNNNNNRINFNQFKRWWLKEQSSCGAIINNNKVDDDDGGCLPPDFCGGSVDDYVNLDDDDQHLHHPINTGTTGRPDVNV